MNALTRDFTDAVEKQFSALNAEVKQALQEAGTAKAIAYDLEQKAVRGGPSDGLEAKSWGEQFAEADGLK